MFVVYGNYSNRRQDKPNFEYRFNNQEEAKSFFDMKVEEKYVNYIHLDKEEGRSLVTIDSYSERRGVDAYGN